MEALETNAPRRGRPPLAHREEMRSDGDMRPEIERPAIRADDPLERARQRASELRAHADMDEEGTDKYYIPLDMIPEGWTYEWKTKTVYGAENVSYQITLRRSGWEPVPASRHPELMPDKGHYEVIEREGMILMERPTEINQDRRAREMRNARNQVKQKEEQLNATPHGQLDRTPAKVNRTVESMVLTPRGERAGIDVPD